MAFALGLLALHPEIQDKLLAHIQSVVAPGQLPVSLEIRSQALIASAYDMCLHTSLESSEQTYADIPKLTYVLAVMHETLRLYPIVSFTSFPILSIYLTTC